MNRSEIRRTKMKPTAKSQAKARQFAKELDDITPALLERAGGKCEVRIVGVCGTGLAIAHRHHKRLRDDPLCVNTLDILLYACDACHRWIHANPKMAYDLGLLIRKWDKGNGYVPISHGVVPTPEPEVGYDPTDDR